MVNSVLYVNSVKR